MNGHNANQRHCTDQTALYQEPHLRAQPSNTNTLIIKRLQRESRDHREEDGVTGCLRRHIISHTENQIPIVKTYSMASVQARKHFFISSPARWGANTFT